MRELNGKVAVVTGAASGIGLATATRFAREGMKVVLADIERSALDRVIADLSDAGHEVLGVPTDVSRWEDVSALADRTLEHFGAVHVVHNNAGVVTGGPVEELSLADWEWVLGVDLWSVIYGVKAFLPLIKKEGEGHIVNTASTAGLQAAPVIGPYNVAKFGVVALTETVARELGRDSAIGASVLCPGAVDTRIVESERNRPEDSAREHSSSPQEKAFIDGASKLLGTRGKRPDEVADMVVAAIHNQEFWILTHDDWRNVLRDRVERMTSENRLNEGFGG